MLVSQCRKRNHCDPEACNDDRAKFYMDFGKSLADANLLAALKETLYGYAETINAYHERMDAIKKQLDSPLA